MRDFRHEAFFYSGEESFLAGTLPFIREGLEAGEPAMVAVSPANIELLRSRLNGSADAVTFADIRELGRNPALMIPAWRDFVTSNATPGGRVRGIAEPIWAERSHSEVVECGHHESLLNLAFADDAALWLRCAYDAQTLRPGVLRGAARNHPVIDDDGIERESHAYLEPEVTGAPFDGPLSEPPSELEKLEFDSPEDLEPARRLVAEHAEGGGIDPHRADGLALAVDELVTNSLRHGGGSGVLRAWNDADDVVCEVSDTGTIRDPLVGRICPPFDQPNGRGLWIANHFCDLLQIRSSSAGTVVRCTLGPVASLVPA